MTETAYTPVAQSKTPNTGQLLKMLAPEIARALPKGMDSDRITRLVMTEIRKSQNTPGHSLTDCTQESFAGALLTASALGLEPGVNGECYLIPYEDKKRRVVECQLQIGYQGVLKMFWQHPRAEGIRAEAVYANDEILEFTKGTGGRFVYRPTLGDRGEVIAYYAEVKIAGAPDPLWDVFTPLQIGRLRRGKVGPSGSIDDPERWMERKVALKQVLKLAPKTTRLDVALRSDERTDLTSSYAMEIAAGQQPADTYIDGDTTAIEGSDT